VNITLLGRSSACPPDENISAVFLCAFVADDVLAVRNERGWDIPGGHLEPGESALAALRRETAEEAAAGFERAEPFAVLSSSAAAKLMVFYVSRDLTLRRFVPVGDALDRQVMPIDELIARYHGDKAVLSALLNAARTIPAQ
jgi:8-oxo-dGTP pyrophosphatase MutT (NUDIX family)